MSVERELALEAQRVAGSKAAGDYAEFFAGLEDFIPNPSADGFIGRDIDFESVLGSVARAPDQDVGQAAKLAARDPIELYLVQIGVGQLLTLQSNWRVLSRTQLKSFSRVPALITKKYSSSARR